MILRNVSIRRRLQGTALIIALLLFGIGLLTRVTINDTLVKHTLLSQVKELLAHELNMRIAEKDFLFRGTIQPSFYETGNSVYLERLDSSFTKTLDISNKLKSDNTIVKLGLYNNILSLGKEFESYNNSWRGLLGEIKTKGFKDYGNIGKMRAQIHAVETIVNNCNDLKSGNYMLMLRRHEKDYLLRKDTKYQQKFENTHHKFVNYLKNNARYKQNLELELIDNLDVYKTYFKQIIRQDSIIGYHNNKGYLSELNLTIGKIEEHLINLESEIKAASKKEVQKSIFSLLVIIIGLSGTILIILFNTARNINNPIKIFKNHIQKLGNGELPDKVTIKGKNEIAEMATSINILTHNLHNTRNFAIEVGQGNLETQIDVFNNQGDLGGSLIEMRNQLLVVAKEREAQKEIDKRHIWANQGIAKIGNIINRNDAKLADTSQSVLSLLVEHLGASMGGVFIKDANEEDLYLKASYAFNLEKGEELSFAVGEGLVGVCAYEGKTIPMDDLSANYLRLSSGFGSAKPAHGILVPMTSDDKSVMGVIEIASFDKLEEFKIEFLENIACRLGTAVQRIQQLQNTEKLLELSKSSMEELSIREKEVQQNMEKLTSMKETMARKERELQEQLKHAKNESFQQIAQLKNQLVIQKSINEDGKVLLNILNSIFAFGQLTTMGEFKDFNENLCKTYDCSEEDLEGFNIRNFVSDEERIDFEIDWNRVINGKIVTRYDHHITATQSIWLKSTYAPIFNDRNEIKAVHFVAAPVDIEKAKFVASNAM
ncbi:MAG: GAF domain-containing protein [Bacteroidales bacterium]|nr:GAF domain-containing protein [Bacteroidales bacterium]